MEYILSEEEVTRIIELTKKISDNNDKNGAVATPFKRSMPEILADGFAAELAFSKISGLPFDDSIRTRVGGADFINNGKTIDVKNTATKHPEYFIKAIKATPERRCDFYAFVIGTINPVPRFEYIGFVTIQQVLECKTVEYYGSESAAFVIPAELIEKSLEKHTKPSLRTDEEYWQIFNSGGYTTLTVDDMKWIDTHQ